MFKKKKQLNLGAACLPLWNKSWPFSNTQLEIESHGRGLEYDSSPDYLIAFAMIYSVYVRQQYSQHEEQMAFCKQQNHNVNWV